MEILLTVFEVAAHLRVQAATVRRLLRRGILKGFKLSESRASDWRVPEKDLARYEVIRNRWPVSPPS